MEFPDIPNLFIHPCDTFCQYSKSYFSCLESNPTQDCEHILVAWREYFLHKS